MERHIEFIDNRHFEINYFRVPPPPSLRLFIDFFWETRFDHLWKKYPKGFSDAQFPNTGYTYIFTLGTPYTMQVEDKKFNIRTDCFLPRYNNIESSHKPGNHLFGIKFKISPVVFEKKIDFSEYKGAVYPLSYLIDNKISNQVKIASSFKERIQIVIEYYKTILSNHQSSLKPVHIVSEILERANQENDFEISLENEAKKNHISTRTLLRYFESCTGIPGKTALQVMRIRKAIAHLIHSPGSFKLEDYGYHDKSHFYKHLKNFLNKNPVRPQITHLQFLSTLHPTS